MGAAGVAFRRVHGRIIPLRKGADGVYKAVSRTDKLKNAAIKTAAGAVIGTAGAVGYAAGHQGHRIVGGAIGVKGANKVKGISNAALKYSSTALAVVGGIVSGLPFGGGLKGLALGTSVGFGIDAVSTAANAAHATRIEGSKKEKIKAFAKHEAVNAGVGYAAFGATLLAQPAVREKLAQWGAKVLSKVVK